MRAKLNKQPIESYPVGCDFSGKLASGEKLVLSGTVNGKSEVSTVVAYDKGGNVVSDNLLVGQTLALNQNEAGVLDTVLQIKVKGGSVADRKYKLSFRAVTSFGNRREADVDLIMRD